MIEQERVITRQITDLVAEIASVAAGDWLYYTASTTDQKAERLIDTSLPYCLAKKTIDDLLLDQNLDPEVKTTIRADLVQLNQMLNFYIMQRNLAFRNYSAQAVFAQVVIGLFIKLARLDPLSILYELLVQLLDCFQAWPEGIKMEPFPLAATSKQAPFMTQLLINQLQLMAEYPELADFQNQAEHFLQALQAADQEQIKLSGLELYTQLQQFFTDRGDVREESVAYIAYDAAKLAEILIDEEAESIIDYLAAGDGDEYDDDDSGDDSDDDNGTDAENIEADEDDSAARVVFGIDAYGQYYLQTAKDTIFIEPARPEERDIIAQTYALFLEYCQSLDELDDDNFEDVLEKYRELYFFVGQLAPLELLQVYLFNMENLLSYDQDQFAADSAAALLTVFGEVLEAVLEKNGFIAYPNLAMQLSHFITVLKEFLADEPEAQDEDDFELSTVRLVDLIDLVEEAMRAYEKS